MAKKYNKQLSILLVIAVILLIGLLSSSSLVAFAKEPVLVNEMASNNVNTTYTEEDPFEYKGWAIKNFKAVIDCSEGRKATIVETIDAYFYESRHGIYRDLTMASGEDYFKIDVVGDDLRMQKHSDYIRLIIGDSDSYVNGEHTYTIKYTVTMPKYNKSKDSLMYNIVPYGFDTGIENFDIKFIMPQELAEDKIYLVSGELGSQQNYYANMQINGNELHITSNDIMAAYKGVSIRMDFPEGTLANVVNLEPLYIFLVGAVIFAAAVIMLFIYGRDDQIVEVVRFDPPYNMPPSDMGYLIDGKLTNEDLTSLFFYWASLGAMEIREEKKRITFIRKGDLPDKCKPYEKEMFNSMFAYGDVVDPTQINELFIKNVQKAKLKISKSYANTRYTATSKKIAKVFMLLSVFFVIGTSILADFWKYHLLDFDIAFLGLIIGAVIYGYYTLSKIIMESIIKIKNKDKKSLYFILFGLLGVIIAVAGMFALSVMQRFTLAKSFCMIICPVLTCWIAPYIHKRSPEYNQILGEILGFRNFILISEKDRLEALVKENPTYYYDILPFANVLGVSDVLSNKFKGIKMELPVWYVTDVDILDVYVINSLARDITASVARQVTLATAEAVGSEVSKFGGGSSGGGFSGGGGFGGGGGGSW